MDYNEFAEKIKTKYPEYNDMDNMELAKRMVAKYPNDYSDVTFDKAQPQKQGFDLTPSGLIHNTSEAIGDVLATPIKALKDKQSIPQAYNELRQVDTTPRNAVQDFTTDMVVYNALPALRGFKGANLLTGAYQGGLVGGLEGLKEGKDPLQSASIGGGLGAGVVAGLPVVGKLANAVSPHVKKVLTQSIPYLKPETVAQAVKPNSVALDLNENTAQNLLMNTTERVRNAYNNLLNKKGNRVGELLEELPNEASFKVGDILQDYDKVYNNYSLSKNDTLNPARNATSKELQKIEDMLYSNAGNNKADFNIQMDELQYPQNALEVVKGRRKGNYWSKTLDSLQNNIELATRKFNNDILAKIKSNPKLATDSQAIQNFENIIEDMRSRSIPDEVADDMYAKLYSAIGKTDSLNPANYKVSPKELYDINKNISDMVDWSAVDAATKNDVLEQMYGANAERISNLSPALKDANAEYSKLMDFQNNEGIRNILNKQNKIDTASSALKNYNSTITKGNTNRNIQDLENILVKEGEAPFLNAIDDVNAAQDLLSTPTTGFNPFGLTNMVKRITNPVLKGVREYNRLSPKLNISDNVKKLLILGGGKVSPYMLQGGITYEEELPY